MKTLFFFNALCFVVVLVLHAEFMVGLMGQLFLGPIQLVIAIVLFLLFKRLDTRTRINLWCYTAGVVIYFIGAYYSSFSYREFENKLVYHELVFRVIPMSLAFYSVIITGLATIKREPQHV